MNSNSNKSSCNFYNNKNTYQSSLPIPTPSPPYEYNDNYFRNVNYYNINADNSLANEIIKEDDLFIEIYPRKKKSEFFDIPTIGKIFLICVFIELLFGFSMFIIRFADWNGFDDNFKISIVGLSCSLFLFYYSFDSIWKENKFQLFSFIVIMSTISIGGLYQFFHIWSLDRDIVNSVRFLSVLVFIPLNIVLGIFSYRKFGWKLYRKIGTSIELRKLFQNYQIFLSLLKMDVFISGLIVTNLSLFYLNHIYEIYINVLVFLLNFIWAIFGYHAIKKENKLIFKLFLLLSWLLVAFNIWKIVIIIIDIFNTNNGNDADHYNSIQFAIPIISFCVISFIDRIMIIFFSIKAINNFNKGLKIVFEKEKRVKSVLIPQQQPIIQIQP